MVLATYIIKLYRILINTSIADLSWTFENISSFVTNLKTVITTSVKSKDYKNISYKIRKILDKINAKRKILKNIKSHILESIGTFKKKNNNTNRKRKAIRKRNNFEKKVIMRKRKAIKKKKD